MEPFRRRSLERFVGPESSAIPFRSCCKSLVGIPSTMPHLPEPLSSVNGGNASYKFAAMVYDLGCFGSDVGKGARSNRNPKEQTTHIHNMAGVGLHTPSVSWRDAHRDYTAHVLI